MAFDGELTIPALIEESYGTAAAKGWHDPDAGVAEKVAKLAAAAGKSGDADFERLARTMLGGSGDASVGDRLMLIVSEVAEALEEFRSGRPLDLIYYEDEHGARREYSDGTPDAKKPEGFAVELADVLIRIFDATGKYRLPLERALRIKLAYNRTRKHRHGGKVI